MLLNVLEVLTYLAIGLRVSHNYFYVPNIIIFRISTLVKFLENLNKNILSVYSLHGYNSIRFSMVMVKIIKYAVYFSFFCYH